MRGGQPMGEEMRRGVEQGAVCVHRSIKCSSNSCEKTVPASVLIIHLINVSMHLSITKSINQFAIPSRYRHVHTFFQYRQRSIMT